MGLGTFSKCRVRLGYRLVPGPLFWEWPHHRALPYTYTIHKSILNPMPGFRSSMKVLQSLSNTQSKLVWLIGKKSTQWQQLAGIFQNSISDQDWIADEWKICSFITPDHGSPFGSSMFFGPTAQSTTTTIVVVPQNMEEPLGLPLSYT
jgi:hypothetical protein